MALDFKLILKGGLSGAPRIARHLWRMCAGLTIASGSFFLGQQKFLPPAWHGSPLLFVPVFAPLVLMVFWLIRVRFGDRFNTTDQVARNDQPGYEEHPSLIRAAQTANE
jgi:hypothetical protein